MSIKIRAYNVLFGDCILVSWDEADGEHHAWVDFGNFTNDPNAVFQSVYDNVFARTGGRLDLLVMTHKHMDHIEGFYAHREDLRDHFEIEKIWHAHVDPSLDDNFELVGNAIREQKLLPDRALFGEGIIGQIYRNNFGIEGLTTQDRMDRIVQVLGDTDIHAVYRGINMADIMPNGINRLGIEILAPERESSAYFEPLEEPLRMRAKLGFQVGKIKLPADPSEKVDPLALQPGIKAEESELIKLADFARLRRKLQTGGLDLLRAADKTRNNTSIVLALTYGGKRFLLTGDAEEKSWEIMENNNADFKSRFIKVSHHGSINASPDWSFKSVFNRKRQSNGVIISTDCTRYTGDDEVPKDSVLEGWQDRLSDSNKFLRTDATGVNLGDFVELSYA